MPATRTHFFVLPGMSCVALAHGYHPLSRRLPLHLAKLAQEYVLPLAPAPAAEPHSE